MPSWNDYGYGSPKQVANGIKPKNERGQIGASWWSKRWLAVLESFGIGSRLTRGRSYARKGQVATLEITVGKVTAKVQGSQPRPYKVTIELAPLTAAQWERVLDAMAGQALFAAKLLAGEMPPNIEEAFRVAKVSLFPTRLEELETECTCPDWANPCKHLAAVYYILADKFDEDPFLLFRLRGRSGEEIIQELRARRTTSAGDSASTAPDTEASVAPSTILPLEESLASFWEAGEGLADFSVLLEPPEVTAVVLKQLGASPFRLGKQNVSEKLAEMYRQASEAALKKAWSDVPLSAQN